jgi:multiple sugar transport system ATP-binding protein
MAQVALESVSKTYPNGFLAVQEATFTVADEEFVVLVGPSGCGKSTLLRMIAGLEEISVGTLRIDGRVVNDVPPRDRDIAMVFQNYALYPHMNVFDNMAMGLRIRKMPKDEVRERVEEAAALLGVRDLLQRRPAQLSGGQRQRVALGRAIVRRPRVFLFDEPLSNLDAKMRVEMRTEISRLHRRLKATMIYVTHDQTEAMTMGDRIVVLDGGHVQQIANPLTLYDRPANRFVAGFLGSPSMNLWPAQFGRDGLNVGDALWRVDGEVPQTLHEFVGRPLVLGIRPEDLALDDDSARGPRVRANVTLEVVEPLGSETLVYWNTAGVNSVARVRPDHAVRVGQEVELRLDLGRAHFFDPDTGATLVSGLEVASS